jgi:hypothetical protein
LIPGAPQIANPQTEWGVYFLNTTAGLLSRPFMRMFGGLVGRVVPAFGKTDWPLPEYGMADKP